MSATVTYEKLKQKAQPIQIRQGKSIGKQTQDEWQNKIKDYALASGRPESYATDLCFIIDRLESARLQRDNPNKYYDDLDFITDYQTNENLKNTYLQRKRNDSEIRVNMGTAEKKIETIYNELLALNIQHDVRAFDTDDYELVELGRDFTDLVTRTNRIEEDSDLWQEAILELLTQRAVYLKEVFLDYPTRNGTRRIRKAQKILVSGLKVYMGDISIPMYRWNEQPYIVEYERMHWRTAMQMYGHLPAFQQVLANFQTNAQYGDAFSYRFGDLEKYEVEVIYYSSLPDNEQNVIINQVPMYEFGSEQTKIPWSFEGYHIQGFNLKSMNTDFALGKPLTASAKPLVALQNEMVRSLLRKFFQAIEPPLAIRGDKTFGRDIWEPGAMAHNVSKNDFESLINHQGVTDSEFNMYKFIESKAEEFIGSSNLQQGLTTDEQRTASEVQLQQQNAAKQLGLAVEAIIRMKREMTKLRISTILDCYLSNPKRMLSPITRKEETFFAGFSVSDVMLDNERRGTKRIEFIDRDLDEKEKQDIFDYEEEQAKTGRQIRIKMINKTKLKNMYLHWFVLCSAKQREGGNMDRLTFKDKFLNAQAISEVTQSPLNKDKVVEDFESKWDAKDWFQKEAPMALQSQGESELNPEQQGNFEEIKNKLESLKNSQFGNGQAGGQTQMKAAAAGR